MYGLSLRGQGVPLAPWPLKPNYIDSLLSSEKVVLYPEYISKRQAPELKKITAPQNLCSHFTEHTWAKTQPNSTKEEKGKESEGCKESLSNLHKALDGHAP